MGSGMTIQENQQAAPSAARRTLSLFRRRQICHESDGPMRIDPWVFCLLGKQRSVRITKDYDPLSRKRWKRRWNRERETQTWVNPCIFKQILASVLLLNPQMGFEPWIAQITNKIKQIQIQYKSWKFITNHSGSFRVNRRYVSSQTKIIVLLTEFGE